METGIYIHVPFCVKRCAYCDFISNAGCVPNIPPYFQALALEIEKVASAAPEPIRARTIYFGGGTPSAVPPDLLISILTTCQRTFQIAKDCEITLEVNPGTINLAGAQQYYAAGFNRISLGMQSANPEELRLLGRIHTIWDLCQAVEWVRKAGFSNISLDLMYNLPGQTMQQWQHSVEMALILAPSHLSLYSLMVEPGTELAKWVDRGLVQDVDDDLAADMVEWAQDRLAQAGFIHYEISNWARQQPDGTISLSNHNVRYWRNQSYLGFGAAAHGSEGGYRVENTADIHDYLRLVHQSSNIKFPFSPAMAAHVPLSDMDKMQETVMLGLRLIQEGVGEADFRNRYGMGLSEVFGNEIQRITNKGLAEWIGEKPDRRLRLSQRGWLVANQAFMEFVGDSQN